MPQPEHFVSGPVAEVSAFYFRKIGISRSAHRMEIMNRERPLLRNSKTKSITPLGRASDVENYCLRINQQPAQEI